MRKNKILVINGPNLNLLGKREPEKYGKKTLDEILEVLKRISAKFGYEIIHYQSNSEGDIVSFIQVKYSEVDGIIINAGAYTHTSIAIRDALIAANLPIVEVHLSNIYKREDFRHKSFISDISIGVIAGFGENSYYAALYMMLSHFGESVF